jgi:hypothetical protein
VAQRRRAEAKRDFDTATKMWTILQDPAESLAAWQSLLCQGQLPITPAFLEAEAPAVRVRVIRNQQERLRDVKSRSARRKAHVEKTYVDRLIVEARTQVAIEDIDWISRITGERT